MKNRNTLFVLSSAVIALTFLAQAPRAMAGEKLTYSMNITGNSYYTLAQGSIADIRNSADTSSFIACVVYYNQGVGNTGYCYAYNGATYQYAGCSTTDPAAIQTINGMKGDSFIEFEYPAGSYTCDYISSTTASRLNPKQP